LNGQLVLEMFDQELLGTESHDGTSPGAAATLFLLLIGLLPANFTVFDILGSIFGLQLVFHALVLLLEQFQFSVVLLLGYSFLALQLGLINSIVFHVEEQRAHGCDELGQYLP